MISNKLIKKGQRVKIRNDISEKTDTTKCGYDFELNNYIGDIMTITFIDSTSYNFQVKGGNGWWFSPNWVDVVEQIHFDDKLFTL
ncbi:MAG: hypothetical protein KQ78_00457 [Candidatus Izimaplasma bacterium HR2]|nr:MAG: hypothetical protein KQ78_00457 [Candidatus Izimaplasma bacterium HR2]